MTASQYGKYTMNGNDDIELSLIVPCYNEAEVIEYFYARTAVVMNQVDPRFEMIFINDGSSDRTAAKIIALHHRDPRVKLIDFSRNFGKEIAMTAGLDLCHGRAVVIIDADL